MATDILLTLDNLPAEIDFGNVHEITFWSKKWEVSPNQLINALYATHSQEIIKIEQYLKAKGVSL